MAIKSKKIKLTSRERTKARLRKKLTGTDAKPRLSVFKSEKHTYAQLISDESGKTIVSASTLEGAVVEKIAKIEKSATQNDSRSCKSVAAAIAVGITLAERAKAAGIEHLVFDRNGFLYHGRVKAVADGARQGGMAF